MYLTCKRIYEFGEFQLKIGARQLERDGNQVPLGSKAFELLVCLVMHAEQVVTKATLLKTVWPDAFVAEANLSQHIFALRKALGDRASFILTVPGQGYQFAAQVREVAEQPTPAPLGNGSFLLQRTTERTHIVIEETTQIEAVAECLRGQPLGIDAQRLQILATQYASSTNRALPTPPWLEAPTLAMHDVSMRRSGDEPPIVALFESAAPQPPSRQSRLLEYLSRHAAIWIAPTVAVLLLLVARSVPRPNASPLPANRTVIIADFENSTHSPEFNSVLRKALEIDLGQSPSLDVISAPEAANILRPTGRISIADFVPETARDLCQRSNRQVLITGSLASVGQLYLLTLEATDCGSGRILAGTKNVVASESQMLDAIDVASVQLRHALGESTPPAQIPSSTTQR
jgi:DNA-binding winged helix-turn-helix (wHTH) protein